MTAAEAYAAATDRRRCGGGECRHAEIGALCPPCTTCRGTGEVGVREHGQPVREHDTGQQPTRTCPRCEGAGR